jgi:hypothetical protein
MESLVLSSLSGRIGSSIREILPSLHLGCNLLAPPNGLEMSRPGSQGQYRTKANTRLAGSAPSSC